MYKILKDPNIGRKVKIIKPNKYRTTYPDGTFTEKDIQPVNSIGFIDKVDRRNNSVLVKLFHYGHYYQWFDCDQIEAVDGN